VLEITTGFTPIGVSNIYRGASYRKIPIGCTIGVTITPIGLFTPIVILHIIGKNTIGVYTENFYPTDVSTTFT
jgi:hypothetical protein